MQLPTNRFAVMLWACSAILLTNCARDETMAISNKAAEMEHDSENVPLTEADVQMPAGYVEAIPRIKIYHELIRAALEAGKLHDAHRPLDELDIVLHKLPVLARDSGIPKVHWETINVTARELRHLFNQIHSAIDEDRKPDYSAVRTGIEEAIGRLDAVAQKFAK